MAKQCLSAVRQKSNMRVGLVTAAPYFASMAGMVASATTPPRNRVVHAFISQLQRGGGCASSYMLPSHRGLLWQYIQTRHCSPMSLFLQPSMFYYTRIGSNKGKNPRAQSSKTHKASTLTPTAQQHHHDSLSQHISQYSQPSMYNMSYNLTNMS